MTDPPAPTWSWDDVPALPTEPPQTSDRDRVIAVGDDRYRELSESGWDALIGWLAGITYLARYPERRTQYVEVTVTDRLGNVESRYETARTTADQAIIDEAVNGYLRDADISDRPTGFRWFQRLPDGRTLDELEGAISAEFEVSPPPSTHPRHVLPVLRDVLDRFYGRAV